MVPVPAWYDQKQTLKKALDQEDNDEVFQDFIVKDTATATKDINRILME